MTSSKNRVVKCVIYVFVYLMPTYIRTDQNYGLYSCSKMHIHRVVGRLFTESCERVCFKDLCNRAASMKTILVLLSP